MAKQRAAWRQDLVWRLEAFGWDLMTAIMRSIPIDAASGFGGWLMRNLGPLVSTHKTVMRNLLLVFPEWDQAERDRVGRAQWEAFGRLMGEFTICDRILADPGRIELVNFERIEEIKASGKPVVFITGHFSNWELSAATVLAKGLEVDITYRALNNPYADARMKESRARYGVRLFAPKGADGARELLANLKRGVSVGMLNDQKYDEGVPVPFFGHTAYTLPAAVRLAMRFGTVIQPISVERTKGARFRCVVYDPISVAKTGDRNADVLDGVMKITQWVEKLIRAKPEEWWWVHRRYPSEVYRQMAAEGL